MGIKEAHETPQIDLSTYAIDQTVIGIIPATVANKHKIIPLFKIGRVLTLAMANPKDIIALDEVRTISGMDISIMKSNTLDIEKAIAEYYGITPIIEDVIQKYQPLQERVDIKSKAQTDAPIVTLVDAVIKQAISEGASDIHIEPGETTVRIRYRVDGILHEEINMPAYMLPPVVSRIKVLSGLNIAENRVPQDGRFEAKIDSKFIDFRVSTFPSSHGEKIVLRILDKSKMMLSLPDIGFSGEGLKKFREIIHRPHGIVLVTGPTGSGKTTTLYASLAELNNKELNITTVEDPIEYELKGLTQCQVNIKAGLTFASALRSILRQDPDVILIGEIRDTETAEIAMQSSMTGHLVFSTLHTNDASSAVVRLVDMNVEPFLISSSVAAIMAQRLVRIVCQKCQIDIPVPDEWKEKFPGVLSLHKGKGCKACKGTGFKGRSAIFEILIVDEEIKKLINAKTSANEIKKLAVAQGMKTLFDDGIQKVKNGITTLDEVLRVTELEQI